jgi:hypothetical protein
MSGRNGMGPAGQGPMTGRGMGRCGGRGGGWRHRHWLHATGLPGWQRAQLRGSGTGGSFTAAASKEQDLAAMKREATNLESALGDLRARIEQIEKPVAAATTAAQKGQR